jgi:hypothetical protein
LAIVPRDDIAEVSSIELRDPKVYMKWQANQYLQPDNTGERRFTDLSENELFHVKDVTPKDAYEPWIPITGRLRMDWGDEQRKEDFALMYGGLLEHEVDSGVTKRFILNESKPQYYRWIYPGPGKRPVLMVGYTHTESHRQYVWTYNRPELDPKQRQHSMDGYLEKVVNAKVPAVMVQKVAKTS